MVTSATVLKIVREHEQSGLSSTGLAALHGMDAKFVARILRESKPVNDPGPAPDECRLGIYRGYRETIEPLLALHGVTWAQFMGGSRLRRVVECRFHAWSDLASQGKRMLHLAQFCGKDHATVINGVRKWRGENGVYFGA
jgi:hypothetical protein